MNGCRSRKKKKKKKKKKIKKGKERGGVQKYKNWPS